MARTVAEGFFTDPRLVEAKSLFKTHLKNINQKSQRSKLQLLSLKSRMILSLKKRVSIVVELFIIITLVQELEMVHS